jgi:tetratricopeptide (TPR) repeat protein
MTHLGKGEIEAFLAGRSSPEDRDRLLKHLLTRCEWCLRLFKNMAVPLLEEEPWTHVKEVPEDAYDAPLARAAAVAHRFAMRWQKEAERLDRAKALVDKAGGLGEQFPLRQAQTLHGWPLCEALLSKSFDERYRDPKKMLRLAYDAARVAEHTPADKYEPSPGFVMDLRARAFAELGNARRINDQFAEAERDFSRARAFLVGGTGDFLLEARVLDLEASLYSSQGHFEDAISLLDKVHDLYQEVGDIHLAGRALISKGFNLRRAGRPYQAIAILEQGVRLVEADRDPELPVIAQQGLLDALVDAGEFGRANRILLASGLREAFSAEPLNLLKLRWVEGKVHAGLGRLKRAETIYCSVREELHRLGSHYDAALLGLDLVALWLRQDRVAEVRTLAEEMYETFELLEVRQAAQHALYFVREACRRQRLTVPMIHRVRSFVEQVSWNPELRFEPAEYAG